MPIVEAAQRVVPILTAENVRAYLESRAGHSVRVLRMTALGRVATTDLKGYGYGTPVRIDYEVDGNRRAAVLETVNAGGFGHEHMADRAQNLLWSHAAANKLPGHVRTIDVGGFRTDGRLMSLGDLDECFILNEYVDGDGYYRDLERLRDGAELHVLDVERADALCHYLVGIHRTSGSDPGLYVRRIRELMGGNECIAGVLDSYPRGSKASAITSWKTSNTPASGGGGG